MKLLEYFKLSNFKFSMKLLVLSLCIILCFAGLIFFYIAPKFGDVVERNTISKLESLVDVPYSIANKHYKAYENGEVTEREAKRMALNEMNELRYSNGEYFWVNDMDAIMLMHPLNPELVGSNMSSYEDVDGLKILSVLTEKVRDKGYGEISYKWNKEGATEPSTKLSYAKGFDKWDWVIGTGIFADDIEAVQTSVTSQIQAFVFPIILGIFVISQIFFHTLLFHQLKHLIGLQQWLHKGTLMWKSKPVGKMK